MVAVLVIKYSFFALLISVIMSDIGRLLHPLPAELKRQIRLYEKVLIKRVKASHAREFNSQCLKEGLFPHYSNNIFYKKCTRPEKTRNRA